MNVTNLNTDNVTNMSYMFSNDPHLTQIVGLNALNTSKVTNMAGMLAQNPGLTNVDLSGLDTTKLTDISHLFDGDQNLAKLNLSGWVFQEGIKDDAVFQNALGKLTALDLTNAKTVPAAVLNAYVAVARNTKAKDIDLSTFSTSRQITNMFGLFANLPVVETINVTNLNTDNVTNMSYMFSNDPHLTKIIGLNTLNTSKVTNMAGMLAQNPGLTNVDLSGLDTTKLTDISHLFDGDQNLAKLNLSGWVFQEGIKDDAVFQNALGKLTALDLTNAKTVPAAVLNAYVAVARNTKAKDIDLSTFSTSRQITNMFGLFANLPVVETINVTNLNTDNVTNMSYMFSNDPHLTKIIGLNTLNTSKVTNMAGMLAQNPSLANVDLSGLDTTKLTDISHLFDGDQNLAKLNLSGWVFQEGIKDDDTFQKALDKLTALDLTNTKTIPAAVLRAYVAVARNTKAKDIDLSTLSISRQITDMSGLFADLPAVETINVANLNTGNVTDMSYMFNNDPQLTQIIGVGGFDTHNVTNMNSMFGAYHYNTVNNDEPLGLTYFGRLKELDLSNWDTSKVTDMGFMFSGQQSLTKIGQLANWQTSQVTDMGDMFEALAALPDDQLTNLNWDTSKVENMWSMFYDMPLQKDLSFVNNWNTANVRNMSYMFAEDPNLTRLDLSKWDVGKVGTDQPGQNYSLAAMFADDRALTSVGDISHWNTANVHDTRYMFGNTASLSNLDLSGWDTSNLEIAGHMFERSGVKEVNLSNWDFHNLKHYNNYGLVDHDGEFRGTEWMFINLLNKCVITMNNISLPDDDNAFSIIDFAGTKPIVVLANGQDGQALPELAALNQQTWKPWNVENEQEITGRQNSNVLTLVKAADPTVKVGERKLNFVFTNQADLENYLNAQLAASQVRSAIGSFGQQWDQQGDTSNGRLKASLRLYPAAGDNFLADWVTPEYQLNTAKPVTPTTPDNPGTTTGNKPGMPGRGGAGTGLNNPRLPGRESAHQAGMNRHATAALPQTGNRDNRSALLGLLALPFLALGALVNRRHEK
uniref:BspA family leucine-rich repeat surface protein n=1 Tax=Limosilactobacillus antri TaxID=227943 RepID=UPI00384F928F